MRLVAFRKRLKMYKQRKEGKPMDRYFINTSRNTLHKIGGCCHSKIVPKGMPKFETEDDAIAYAQRYMQYCKLCFKKR